VRLRRQLGGYPWHEKQDRCRTSQARQEPGGQVLEDAEYLSDDAYLVWCHFEDDVFYQIPSALLTKHLRSIADETLTKEH
jgi:hypothetical protein